MNIEIVKASYNDLQLLHKIQVEAFRPLLENIRIIIQTLVTKL